MSCTAKGMIHCSWFAGSVVETPYYTLISYDYLRTCVGSYIDPESHNPSKLPAQFIQTHESPSNRWRAQLGDINRRKVRSCSDSNAGQNSSSVNQSQPAAAVSTEHEPSSENEDSSEDLETLLAA